MRSRSACVVTLAVMAVTGGLGVIPARAVETTTDKPSVRIPEDKALVYFVRPKRPGSRLITFLYIDDEFVGALEDNSFTYAFVEEGRHVLWTFVTLGVKARWFKAISKYTLGPPWEGSGFLAVRGRTYYFWFDDPGEGMDVHVQLDENEGARWIDKVKFYSTPTGEEVQASAQHLANRSPEVVERLKLTYAKIPEYPTPEAPADPTGLIRVDANTEVSLMLVQNLWSERDATGDEVWFRVTSDSASAEGVWLREGTLVRGILYHVKDSESSVGGGVLDVAIPALVAVDGTVVPTQAEIHEQGGGLSKGSRGTWNFLRAVDILEGGDDNYGPYGGKAALLLLGSTMTIHTRDAAWITPEGTEVGSAEQTSRTPPLRLRVPTSAPVETPWSRSGKRNDLEFLLDLPQRPVVVRVRSIAGQSVPAEIEAKQVRSVSGGWLCTFDWWHIVRFLPPVDERSHMALVLDGALEDGTAFVVDTAVEHGKP